MRSNAAIKAAESFDSRVVDPSDPRWVRLRDIIRVNSLMKGDFTLSSGRKSSYLFQLRQTTMLPEGQSLIGQLVYEYMMRMGIDTLGGLVLGAVPVVCAAAFASHNAGQPVKAFFVRKEAKVHGAKELIDGHVDHGTEVLIIDDVTTTGKSMYQAVENLRDERGSTVKYALSVVDREEGATEELIGKGIVLASIFKKTDFAD